MASNMNPTLLERTMLFPCAAGVQMPQLGAEDSKVKVSSNQQVIPSLSVLPLTIVPQDNNPAAQRYVKMVSSGLSFTQDVVEDRCLHMMPYDDKYFQEVFKPSALLPIPPRSKSVMGRHNKRGFDSRHMPCMLKSTFKPAQLTPLRKQAREKALELYKEACIDKQKDKANYSKISQNTVSKSSEDPLSSSFFITEIGNVKEQSNKSKLKPINTVAKKGENLSRVDTSSLNKKSEVKSDESTTATSETLTQPLKNDWDDHLMSRLSKLTANWIVHEKLPEDRQKEKLSSKLEGWYGRPTHTDLVREQPSDEEDEDAKEHKPKKKWKKTEASVIERVYNIDAPQAKALDPYSDDNKAPFYRQPAGIRKKRRSEEKEEAGAINATAHNVNVQKHTEITDQNRRDVITPRVGDKVYDTNNLYQQEWLTGTKQLYKVDGDHNEIIMENKNKYLKQMQRQLPEKPETWYTIKEDGESKTLHIPEKGHKRWIGLPEPIDDTKGLISATEDLGFDQSVMKAVDPKHRRRVKSNHALVTIVQDWRSKWFLSGQFADSTPDDLIRDMADIQPHVRLKAIGTVAKASEYKPPPNMTVMLEMSTEYDPVKELPEKIFVALECLMDDSHYQVRKAAAITLYSLDRPTEKAKLQLREMLVGTSSVDRWAAAQCLAQFGECDSDVVAEIIRQILTTEVAVKLEQGIYLLAKISNSDTLVHCMVAEQLNSSSWRHRVIACKILPTLFGTINKDITQKLSELMWHDWHTEVRSAAAQCLGKTSHGRDVHDDIRERILNSDERTKMEAINKLGQLGIMTAKLLPAFLECFADPYVSIRSEVCITCGNLEIKEEQVLDRLVHLATFDPIWKVKALAIQALGKIGEITEDIKECLLWAMRYEEIPGVRAEACHSLVELNIQDDDVIEALQDRLLVESDPIVREEMIAALSVFGLSTSDDMDMVAQIKSEVRKLCTRNVIASQIIVNENDDTKRAQLQRMVCQTEEDIEAMNEKKAEILQRIRSSARQSRQTDCQSQGSSPLPSQPRTSTPLPADKSQKPESESTTPEPLSREGTVFTPTADRELEAILNQEEMASVSGSASGKSRPATCVSEVTDVDNESGQDEVKVHSRITITKVENGAEQSGGHEASTETTDGESIKLDSQDKNRLSIPPQRESSQREVLSPTGSFGDLKGPRLSVAQFSDRRSVVSRDSLREREKLNVEVNAVYSDLDARYAGMIDDLIQIDKGLNTKVSSTESSFSLTPNLLPSKDIDEAKVEKNSKNPPDIQSPVKSMGSVENQPNNNKIPENYQNEQEKCIDIKLSSESAERKEVFPDSELKSHANLLSPIGDTADDATSFPSCEESEDVDNSHSAHGTAGAGGVPSEYESVVKSDDEIKENL